jgi:DNA-binding NarL/FixJ family response regulator
VTYRRRHWPTWISQSDIRMPDLNGITGRERHVLTLIGQGATNAGIAERMHITTPTVKTYVGRLTTKPAARDRVQLVIVAYRTGLVTS